MSRMMKPYKTQRVSSLRFTSPFTSKLCMDAFFRMTNAFTYIIIYHNAKKPPRDESACWHSALRVLRAEAAKITTFIYDIILIMIYSDISYKYMSHNIEMYRVLKKDMVPQLEFGQFTRARPWVELHKGEMICASGPRCGRVELM